MFIASARMLGAEDSLDGYSRLHGSCGFHGRLVRVPNSGGDVTFWTGLLVPEVVNSDDLAIRPLDTARVADIAAAAVLSQCNRVAPGTTTIVAQAGVNPPGRRAAAIGQA